MSEEFYGKSIPITSGFDLGAKSPLDTRSIVNTIEERNAHVTGNRVYEGMKVYVLAEKKEYRYNGNDWEEVGGITDEQLEKLTIAYEHSQTPHVTEEYVDTKIAEASLNGTTEVSQGETEPTEESVLLWIDTTSDENMVENNLSNSLITEFQDSISTLNTRVSTLEKNIEPPFGEDAHTHSNKAVLDKITQAQFDKWNNKSDFNGSYNSLTDKPTIPTRTSELINDSNYVTTAEMNQAIADIPIGEQVDLTNYQTKTDNTLNTTDKTVIGAINEINTLLGKCLPFEDSYVSNCNTWLTNGYTKTSTSTTNHPSLCTGKDRWGILFFIAENAENGTGTQMYFPIDGNCKGAIFTRSITNRSAGEWKRLATISDIPTTLPANGGNANTVGGYTIWTGTQSEYDAISSKNSTTIYFIKG